MDFEEKKKKQLGKIDKSNIGSWDKKILDLCKKLNKSKNYYTTSSCAGRVVLLKSSDKKIEDAFLFRSHKKVSFGELKKALNEIAEKYKGQVNFQQTSCILHVACRKLDDAQRLVDKAKFSGWKRSGIMSTGKRFVTELHSTELIDFPIMDEGKVLVDDKFLKLVVKEANDKLGRVWEKIERLRKLV